MLLNSDFKTAKGADSRQRAESLSRAVGKHGLLGMKKMEGMMKERLASRLLSFVLEGQGRWWTREILQKYMSTPARIRTHTQMLFPLCGCVGIHEDKLSSTRFVTYQRHTQTHQTRYWICAVIVDSVSTVWFPASDPIMINDSMCVWAVSI